jgi:Protein of unknown function (DUF4019)
MKVGRFSFLPLVLAALGGGAFLGLASAWADSDNDAADAVKLWLAEIDSGKYQQSYDEGCAALHNKVTKDQWLTVMNAIRAPLGTLVSRKEASHVDKPDGVEGLQGECMVFTYNTSFSKVDSSIEIVVLKKEDGVWKGAGYNEQPQGPAPAPAPPPPPPAP